MLPLTTDLYATARTLAESGQTQKAISVYRRLLSINPNDARALLQLGDLQLHLDQHDKALSAYERVAEHYYRDGNSIKAIAVYKHIHYIITHYAPLLEPRYRHTIVRSAEILLGVGLTDDALAAYDRAAQGLLAEGRTDEIPELFRKLLALVPDNPVAHVMLGESLARLGKIEKAIEHLSRAATMMVNLGRRNDALRVLETLLSYKKDPVFASIAAKLYLHRGDQQSAMAALAKLHICYKADPGAIDVMALLARAFEQVEQWDKAMEVRKQAAWIAWQKGDKAGYQQMVSQLIARAHDDPSVMQLAALERVQPGPNRARILESLPHDTVVDLQPPWLTDSRWPIPA
jgi:tetratricopeptide (TPR) repeat protein